MRWTHESMTIDAVRNAFSEKIACCGDSSENRATIEKLAKIISDANIATDTNEKYGENMAYHYNRGLRESPDEARMRYIMTQIIELYNLSKQLQIAFVSPRNRKKACTDSLDIIGRLAHMWQDYYAHGIDPTWLTVGSISGAPYFPSATPSSWGGLFWGGEHGGIGTFLFVGIWYGGAFEPGMRAPDRDERIKRSNEKTKFLMKYLLSAWMFTCGCEYFNSPTR